jgi:hypothetical protein
MSDDRDRASATGRLPRRATDRVEEFVAWILAVGALLVVAAASVTGLAVHGSEAERVESGSGSVSQARAVLLEDTAVATGEYGMHHLVLVPARWTDRTGHEHTDAIVVPYTAPAGTEVAVWVDATGNITAPPLHRVNAVFAGIVAAIGVLCAGATVLVTAWLGVRGVTGRVNSRRWERGWERVEPRWRRTVL